MAVAEAEVEFAAELRFFLRSGQRERPVRFRCNGVSSLGHVVESLGVPLTEVGRLTVNGAAVTPSYRLAGDDRVTVAAVSRPQPVPGSGPEPGLRPGPQSGPGAGSQPEPGSQAGPGPRFVLDVHLGAAARRLRLVGLDTAYRNDADDAELVDQANAEGRMLLTQDRGLLRRRRLWLGAFVRGARPAAQFADILDRFTPPLAPWTRCPACNGLLVAAAKPDVAPQLEPGTRRTYDVFARCPDCHRVYWHGAHAGHLDQIVATARDLVAAR